MRIGINNTEKFLEFINAEAEKIMTRLNDKNARNEFETINDNVSDIKVAIEEKTCNAIIKRINQMKIKDRIDSIELGMESIEFPFPPLITVHSSEKNYVVELEFVKPKEFHYELDAISGDYNFQYGNDIKMINETFHNIVNRLQQFDWNTICCSSDSLNILFVQNRSI